jgi:hypothetical protein
MYLKIFRLWAAIQALALVGAAQNPISAPAAGADREQYRQLSTVVRPPAPSEPTNDWKQPGKAQAASAVDSLKHLARRTVMTALQSSKATSKSVADAVRELQGENSLDAAYPFTGIPRADLADINGLPTAVVASAVVDGGYGIPGVHPSIQFYSKAGGVWSLRQELGAEFEGRSFSMSPMRSPVANEVRYFVWGGIIGHSAPPLRCRLYAFDGFEVRTLWERDGLRTADLLNIGPDEIELEYYVYPPDGVYVPPTRVVERWRSSPSGLVMAESPSRDVGQR